MSDVRHTGSEVRWACRLCGVQELEGVAEWQRPQAGMFIWLKLLGVQDVDDIARELVQANVMVLPGLTAHLTLLQPSTQLKQNIPAATLLQCKCEACFAPQIGVWSVSHAFASCYACQRFLCEICFAPVCVLSVKCCVSSIPAGLYAL